MGVMVARTPMNPKVYRAWARVQLVSLFVGVPVLVLLLILSWTGAGTGTLASAITWILAPCVVGFLLSNSVCRIYYPRD